ncbi:MAG TPA: flagellar protein FlaG [Azospira sp.]|nr:flagellar protein FlaG [Azospira sp.]
MSIQPLSSGGGQYYSPPATNGASAGSSVKETPLPPVTGTSAPRDAAAAKPADQKEALQAAAQKANQAILGLGSDLRFSIDEDTGIHIVKFVDDKTKEVIRQIPAQEMLDIAKRLDELKGLLIKERA